MSRLAFVDSETTGLDPARHEVWELAIVTVAPWETDGEVGEWTWHLPVDLARADPTGLRIGRYYERRRRLPSLGSSALVRYPASGENNWERISVDEVASTVAGLLDGAHMVGAVPSFDASFLGPWLREHGQAPTWHYQLIDVETLAAGYLAGSFDACQSVGDSEADGPSVQERRAAMPPWDSEELSLAVDVDPDDFDRHTALGDALWARAIYMAVLGEER